MKKALEEGALNQIFREARTHGAWLDKPVSDEMLRQLYDLMKWGPAHKRDALIGFERFSTPIFGALVPTVHSSALQPMEADLVSSLGDLRAAKSHRLTACLPRPAFRCF